MLGLIFAVCFFGSTVRMKRRYEETVATESLSTKPINFETLFSSISVLLTQFLDKHHDSQLLACSQNTQRVFGPTYATHAMCRPLEAVQKYGKHGCTFVKRLVIVDMHDIEVIYTNNMNISQLYLRCNYFTIYNLCAHPPKDVTYLNVVFPRLMHRISSNLTFCKWTQLRTLVFAKNFDAVWKAGFLPPNLTTFELQNEFNQRLYGEDMFPDGLTTLVLGKWYRPLNDILPKVQNLTIQNGQSCILHPLQLPDSILGLKLSCFLFRSFHLPPFLQRLELCGSFSLRLVDKLPSSLTYLNLRALGNAKFIVNSTPLESYIFVENDDSEKYVRLFVNPQEFPECNSYTKFDLNWVIARIAPQLCPNSCLPFCYSLYPVE